MTNLKKCYDLLKENDEKIYTEVCDVLSRLCRNVIKNPNELKYRKVRLSNPIVAEKILPAVGAMECLFEIGFIERDDHLLLPENAPLFNLKELLRLLSEPQVKKIENKQAAQESNRTSLPTRPSTSIIQSSPTPGSPAKGLTFFKQIEGHFDDVLKYENDQLQNRTRGIIPLADLQITAMEKMRLIQRDVKTNGDHKSVEDISIEDLLFTEVLKWFKEKFFKWVDSPDCNTCGGKSSFQRVISSQNPGISRIEIHRCGTCGTTVEFPRYSDPALLLYSRKGRCGEWANMFALICRSLGYDTRLVWDYTDHVWVEIWSIAANRWIHADPCENVMDRPLMYEKGWGKELSYILAFSKDEMQDVTWRYTSDQKNLMKRRNLCSEESLLSFITSLNENRRRSRCCSVPRQQFLIKRSLMELVEFINTNYNNGKNNDKHEEDYQGRTSGSLAWRLARHETKIDSHSSHIWRIPAEIDSVKLNYTASTDEYVLVDRSERILEKKEGWSKGVWEMNGIFRKIENDWKMVYLARDENSKIGGIEWSFETTDSNVVIEKLKFQAITALYHNAKIEWKLKGFYKNGKTKVISINDSKEFETQEIKGSFKINLSATLSGGDKQLAWQHAQLFRQSLDAKENSMQIYISLDKLNSDI